MPQTLAADALRSLSSEISTCSRCRLCEGRTNAVPGTGSPTASIVFIGEGPGKTEDERGIPFCGASGRFLDTLLASIALSREDVFITNIVKCRPPANRDPKPDEKQICASTFLDQQLAVIQPKLIVTLGRHALAHFLPELTISEVHGTVTWHENRAYLALYHPAVALYNPGMRETLANDFSRIPHLIEQLSQQTAA